MWSVYPEARDWNVGALCLDFNLGERILRKIIVNVVPPEVPQPKHLGPAAPRALALGLPQGLHSPWYHLGFSTYCLIISHFYLRTQISFVGLGGEEKSGYRQLFETVFVELSLALPMSAIHIPLSDISRSSAIHKLLTTRKFHPIGAAGGPTPGLIPNIFLQKYY